jgi:hypothetical protein
MSNYLAIATVTVLSKNFAISDPTGYRRARATTCYHPEFLQVRQSGVNIFLYQVTSNPSLANYDSTPNRTKGNPLNRQVAIDLFYMMSCYSNDAELQPQRVLGSVVQHSL